MSEIHFNDNSPINRAIKLIDQKAGYGLGTVVETGEAVYVQPTREQWNRKLLEMGFKTDEEYESWKAAQPARDARRAARDRIWSCVMYAAAAAFMLWMVALGGGGAGGSIECDKQGCYTGDR